MTAQWDPKWTGPARQALLKNGYEPIPLNGKIPVLEAWQHSRPAPEDIVAWETSLPNATDTEILTHHTPAVDNDVLDQEVADIIHDMVKELIPPDCPELLRYGQFPKRAILFRCNTPFSKVSTGKWIAENGVEHQLEVLCDGQQLACFGTHPDTQHAYRWPGATPGKTPRDRLPLLTAEAAQALIERARELFQERGWRPKREEKPKGSGASKGFRTRG